MSQKTAYSQNTSNYTTNTPKQNTTIVQSDNHSELQKMDGNTILRNRVEEQSSLICSLKSRNDHLLSKINAAEKQNLALVNNQAILKQQIEEDSKRFELLETRFDDLSKYNNEIIAIKNEYKQTIEKLTEENASIRNQLNEKDSQRIIDFYNQIDELKVQLAEKDATIGRKESEILKKVTENSKLKEKLSQINKTVIPNLEKSLKISQSENDHSNKKIEELIVTKENLEANIAQNKTEIKNLINTSFSRAQKIEELEHLIEKRDSAVKNLKIEVQELKDKWELEKEKVDRDYKIKMLQQALNDFKGQFEALNLHKNRLKKELSNEKILNQKLRNYQQ